MSYTKTDWKDHIVENPKTYRMVQNDDGTITLIPEPGEIYQQGTAINATNLNKIEDELVILDDGKVDKVAGKGLSSEDFTSAKSNQIETNKSNIETLSQNAVKTAPVLVTAGTDLDNLRSPNYKSGFYRLWGAYQNSPLGDNSTYGNLLVIDGSSGNACTQLFLSATSGNIYQRGYTNNRWYDWKRYTDETSVKWEDVSNEVTFTDNEYWKVTSKTIKKHENMITGYVTLVSQQSLLVNKHFVVEASTDLNLFCSGIGLTASSTAAQNSTAYQIMAALTKISMQINTLTAIGNGYTIRVYINGYLG